MAIDTTEKKMSLLSFGRPGFTLPVAVASFTQGEEQHLLGLYSDILVAVPTVGRPLRVFSVYGESKRVLRVTGDRKRVFGVTASGGG